MVGRTLHYILSKTDVEDIRRRRTSSAQIARMLSQNPPTWPAGAQAHIGSPVEVGDELPLIVTKEHGAGIMSGQVLLDGTDTLWVECRAYGSKLGEWHFPEDIRV